MILAASGQVHEANWGAVVVAAVVLWILWKVLP